MSNSGVVSGSSFSATDRLPSSFTLRWAMARVKLSFPCQNRLLLSEDIRSCTVDFAPAAASPNSTFWPGKSMRMVAAGSV